MYVALKHIGGKYTPGEILPDNLSDDTLKWLLEAGAIRKVAPASFTPVNDENTPPDPSELQKKPQAPNADADTAEDKESGADNAGSEDAEDEIDEDAEIPEIDVMDGVVSERDDVQAVKKPGGRRKTK